MDFFVTFLEGIISFISPCTLLIDADGNVVNRHVGAMDEAALRAYVEGL